MRAVLTAASGSVLAADATDLAKQLANPVADLISASIQANYDENISSAFIQPFLVYVIHTRTTLTLNTESTYNWKGNDWSVPINLFVAQMVKAGDQLFQVGIGARYRVETPKNGPQG